jgi:molybdopterin synthase catalytic subunit
MAEKRLNEIRERALQDYDIIEASIIHRVGRIETGENIVLMSSPRNIERCVPGLRMVYR